MIEYHSLRSALVHSMQVFYQERQFARFLKLVIFLLLSLVTLVFIIGVGSLNQLPYFVNSAQNLFSNTLIFAFWLAVGMTGTFMLFYFIILILSNVRIILNWFITKHSAAMALFPELTCSSVVFRPIISRLVSIAYRLTLALILMNILLMIYSFHQPSVHLNTLKLHILLGVLFMLVFSAGVYRYVRRTAPRTMAVVFVLFPFFVFQPLFCPMMLLPYCLIVYTLLPIILFLSYLRYSPQSTQLKDVLWCATYYLLMITIVSGFLSVLGPNPPHYLFFHRKIHNLVSYCAIGALVLQWLNHVFPSLFSRMRTRVTITVLIIGVAILFGLGNQIRKQGILEKVYAAETYSSPALAKKEGLPQRVLNTEALEGSAECGSCHQREYNQWAVSVHANAARNQPFQKIARSLAKRYGTETLRQCATCHDPAVSLADNPALLIQSDHVAKSEGVSCRACHYMIKANAKNGEYAVAIPRSDRVTGGEERNEYINKTLSEHVADNNRPLIKDGSHCYPCHSLEATRDGKKMVPLDNVSSFVNSSFADRLRCHWCHMPPLEVDDSGYTWNDHRMFGSHYLLEKTVITTAATQQAFFDRFAADQKKWLEANLSPLPIIRTLLAETLGADPRNIHPHPYHRLQILQNLINSQQGHFSVSLKDILWKTEKNGLSLELVAEIGSIDVAHDFPSSLFANLARTWVEFNLCDPSGKVIYQQGSPDLWEDTLDRIELLADGRPIKPEESPEYQYILYKQAIQPDKPLRQPYRITIDDGLTGPLTAKISLKYQRYAPEHYRLGTQEESVDAETIVLAEKNFILQLPLADIATEPITAD